MGGGHRLRLDDRRARQQASKMTGKKDDGQARGEVSEMKRGERDDGREVYDRRVSGVTAGTTGYVTIQSNYVCVPTIPLIKHHLHFYLCCNGEWQALIIMD